MFIPMFKLFSGKSITSKGIFRLFVLHRIFCGYTTILENPQSDFCKYSFDIFDIKV